MFQNTEAFSLSETAMRKLKTMSIIYVHVCIYLASLMVQFVFVMFWSGIGTLSCSPGWLGWSGSIISSALDIEPGV